ncbi:C40 family peptidase [Chryseobacterium oryctis]|uniref:NlpC/P60 family protein n=1 Tax=Chryseobacterium oryctis TaxID=2952618 RepID=A0ABT3HRH8_9FLAO|nr:NlpC/P60 family protein [Chryseobacterium oryctis]MCW3162380.1 NlpC/P60 family protein [Chryseobacterium oryctis]
MMKYYICPAYKVWFIPLLYLFTLSCNSKKYITDIPYNYSSDKLNNTQNAQEGMGDGYTVVDDNKEGLSDEDLRIKEKYSIILKVMPKEVQNYKLYSYIDKWLGTPYKSQKLEENVGVDCSYFVQALYSDVFNITFPKTSDGIFRSKSIQLFTGRTFLKEGDILFFRYDKFHPISDVGIYLHNDRILACTANGLNIYNFNDEYFQLRYVAAGRLKPNNN